MHSSCGLPDHTSAVADQHHRSVRRHHCVTFAAAAVHVDHYRLPPSRGPTTARPEAVGGARPGLAVIRVRPSDPGNLRGGSGDGTAGGCDGLVRRSCAQQTRSVLATAITSWWQSHGSLGSVP